MIKQYTALLETELVKVNFTEDGIAEIAEMAALINERTENIGARRLYTMMERLLDEISFDAPEMSGKSMVIDTKYVREKLKDFVEDEDLSRYIL
jgi:ATP-dependent HslUV protease ATP-binding subunit HslU